MNSQEKVVDSHHHGKRRRVIILTIVGVVILIGAAVVAYAYYHRSQVVKQQDSVAAAQATRQLNAVFFKGNKQLASSYLEQSQTDSAAARHVYDQAASTASGVDGKITVYEQAATAARLAQNDADTLYFLLALDKLQPSPIQDSAIADMYAKQHQPTLQRQYLQKAISALQSNAQSYPDQQAMVQLYETKLAQVKG